MKKEYIPFVYIVKNKTTNLKYIGVKYAKGCHPDDFWVTYFTSSNAVKKLIEVFGKEDFSFKIIHTYPNDPESAILKEAFYFSLIKKRDDYLNMTYSSGIQDLRICSKAGKVGGSIVKKKKIGICTDDVEKRREWASLGGKAGSKVQIENNIGIHISKTNPKLHKKYASIGGKNGLFSINYIMRQNNCTEDEAEYILKQQQSDRGKIGGKGNKGFKWYNDGENSFKYTVKQQKIKSFGLFLKENEKYKKGRILK